MEQNLGGAQFEHLTPGGLRGGGAVEAYRRGLPVSEIQWRMRLKHQHTLEFYLQELGAVSALAGLNSSAARRVRAAAACFDSWRFLQHNFVSPLLVFRTSLQALRARRCPAGPP